MKAETYTICSGPYEEDLAVVGDPGFFKRNLKECVVFARQLTRNFGEPPARSDLLIKSEINDSRVFWSVNIRFDPEDSEAVAYANRVENGVARWDKTSLEELGRGISKPHGIGPFRCFQDVENEARTDIYEPTSAAFDTWRANLDILIQYLNACDEDASHEAVFILLVQGLGLFGPDSMLMQECFPVLHVLKSRIDSSDFAGALRQALSFRQQLEEVAALVRGGTSHAGQGIQASPTIPPDAEDAP